MSTSELPSGPVVVDTGVFGAELVPGSDLAKLYRPVLSNRPAFIWFQTVAELRYGARPRGWDDLRLRQLEARIARAEIVYPGPDLIETQVDLRVACARVGHALADRVHDADRWIAATALRLGIPLLSHEAIFRDTPGSLSFETQLPDS